MIDNYTFFPTFARDFEITDCCCPQLFEDRDRFLQIMMQQNQTLHSSPCCGSNNCCNTVNPVPPINTCSCNQPINCCGAGKMVIPQLLPNPCCGGHY